MTRRWPARMLLVVLAVVFAFAARVAGVPESVQLAIVGLVAGAVGADTYRPSGTVK